MALSAASWYNESWSYRWPVAVDVSAAGATSDVSIPIPADLDVFWDNVLSSGNDIRITAANGRTLVTYDIAAGFDTATRTGTLEVDNLDTSLGSSSGASTMLLWVYWGNSGASDARSAFAPASAINGAMCTEAPVAAMTVQARHEKPGSTAPSQRINVYNGATFALGVYTEVWMDLTPALVGRTRPFNGSMGNASASATRIQIAAQGAKTTVNASTYSETKYRYCYGADGRLYAKFVLLTDSYLSDGTTYTATVFVYGSQDTTFPYGYSFEIFVSDLL